jgi:hypothetical protein
MNKSMKEKLNQDFHNLEKIIPWWLENLFWKIDLEILKKKNYHNFKYLKKLAI